MGRRPGGSKLVEGIEGSESAKARLEEIIETLAGHASIKEAAEKLGIGEAMFHRIRTEALRGAIAALEPKPMGRPRNDPSPEEEEIQALREELKRKDLELQAARIREEIALAMPYLRKGKKGTETERR